MQAAVLPKSIGKCLSVKRLMGSVWDGLPIVWHAEYVPIRSFASCNLNSFCANFFCVLLQAVAWLGLSCIKMNAFIMDIFKKNCNICVQIYMNMCIYL